MSRVEGYALSPQQQEAWLNISEGYQGNVQVVFNCNNQLNWEKLCAAVYKVLKNNHVYKTKFAQVPGSNEAIQLRGEQDNVKIELFQVSGIEEAKDMIRNHSRDISYTDGTLLHVSLYHTQDKEFNQLVFSSSPLCTDLWGIHVLAINVFAVYNNTATLPEPTLDYLQFAEWQNQLLESEDVDEGKVYWQERLAIKSTPPDIIFSRKHNEQRPDILTLPGKLDNTLTTLLAAYPSCESLLAACWYTVLWKLNNNTNFPMGHIHHGRSFEQLYHVVGSFSKVLPLQLNLHPHLSLSAFIGHYEHEISLADMHKEALNEDEHYHHFIDANLPFRFQYTDYHLLADNLHLTPSMLLQPDRSLKLQLQVDKVDYQYYVTLYYDSLAYQHTDIDYLVNAWQAVLQQAVTEAHETVVANAALVNDKYRTMLDTFSFPESIPVPDIDIISFFRQQVAADKHKAAVIDTDQVLSYDRLDEQSSLLAKYLLSKGYMTGHNRIGIIQRERSEMIVSIMAILKAGGTYVPIDPNDAEKRIQHIVKDSEITCILTISGQHVITGNEQMILVELDKLELEELPLSQMTLPERASTTPAYVIYTSGTSGLPKGVIIEDISLVNYVSWLQRFAGISHSDSAVLLSSYAFDLGYTALWGTLLSGGTLYLIPKEQVQEMDFLIDYIITNKIRFIKTTPSFFNVLIRAAAAKRLAAADLRLIILGGEIINVDDLSFLHMQINQDITVINHYGPTETTIGTIAYKINWNTFHDFKQHPVIGRPVSNNRVIVLDSNGQLSAPGLVGEICIGGAGLAEGYLNRQDLTDEKFIIHQASGERIYYTGDAGTWMPDGTILYLGRKDDQVKIRGYRVEPGEVKQAISQYPGVVQAVVVVKGDPYNRQLIAYVTAEDTLAMDSLKAFLKQMVPDYMVPAHIIQLNKIPLTPNHKVDYKALPDPGAAQIVRTSLVKPRSKREAHILNIWCQVLANENISIDDDFFDLGGHSLKAIQVVNRLQKELKIKSSLKDIFNFPTVRTFHDATRDVDEEMFQYIEAVPEKAYYELSNSQKRIWFTSQRKGSRNVFNVPLHCLFKGKLNTARLEDAFVRLIKRHEALRTIFKAVEGEVVQIILPPEKVNFSMQYLAVTNRNEVTALVSEEATAPFDLENEIGIRAKLISIADEENLLLFTLHHIISDGWSREIIYKELLHFYEADYYGRKEILTPLRIQYKDYVNWHNQIYKEQEQFWSAFFAAGIPDNNFPLDFSRPKTLTFEGNVCIHHIGKDKLSLLKKAVNEHKLTLNSLLMGVYGLLLGEYCGTNQVMVGTVVSGRSHLDLEEIVGVFINYLPFKIDINSATDFITYITTVNQNLITIYQHQEYPFDLMVEKFGGSVKPGRNPVFDTMMIFHEEENRKSFQELPGNIKIEQYEDAGRQYLSKLDFKIDVTTNQDGILLRLEYNRNLFREQTMQLLLERYVQLLLHAAVEPSFSLEALAVIPEVEKAILAAGRKKQEKGVNGELKVIASFTAEPLEEPLNWWMETFEQPYKINFGNYHQVFQELMSTSLQKGEICVLLNRLEDYVQDWDGNDSIETLEMVYNKMVNLVTEVAQSVPVIMVLLPPSENRIPGKHIIHHIHRLNESCYKVFQDKDNVYLTDLRNYKSLYPRLELFDDISYKQARIPFTEEGFYFIGYHINRLLWALKGNPCKVIALDCDNTLWEGVCGEDNEVYIREGHRALQQYFVQKYNEGFLLVLLSKNNEEDVWQVFEHHPHMMLKKEHFINSRINWDSKSENIKSLAKELNVGLDSFAFIDDSPVECYQMMEENPEVLTLELPEDHHHYTSFLKQVIAFDKLKISGEDAVRNEMYKAEMKRSVSFKDTGLSAFLENLQLQMSFRTMAADELERVAQLTQRTNQFNLNGIRRSKQEIARLLENKAFECYAMHVRDRFGDYGLVGVIILEQQLEWLFLHSFLLSCRVLGRGIEGAVLNVLQDLAHRYNATQITAAFRQTPKNIPFSDFLANNKWVRGDEHGDEILYQLPVDKISAGSGYIDVYIDEDLPAKDRIDPVTTHTAAVDFVFDHIGIAVTNIAVVSKEFETLGFQWGQQVFDPLQNCMLIMGAHPAYYNIELIAGAGEGSPLNNILRNKTVLPYHICFRVRNHQEALDYLNAVNLSYEMAKASQPAVLFNNLKVLFIYLEDVGLVELIEDAGMDTHSTIPAHAIPVVQLMTNNTDKTMHACQLLGFNAVKDLLVQGSLVKNKQSIYIDIVSSHSQVLYGQPDDIKEPGAYRLVLDTNSFGIPAWNDISYMLFMPVAKVNEQPDWIWKKNLCNEEQLLHRQVYKALEYGNLSYLEKMKQQKLQLLAADIASETPDNELTVTLISFFREILKNKNAGINDDFFQLGGHSIKAVKLLSRIYNSFGVEISLADFFEMSTVKLIAEYIAQQQLTDTWMQTTIEEGDERFDEIML